MANRKPPPAVGPSGPELARLTADNLAKLKGAQTPMTPLVAKLVLALASLAALLLSLAGLAVFALVAGDKADKTVVGSVLTLISTVLGGAVTLAFHSFFRELQKSGD